MLFIFVLALILIGPKQLPEVARTIGRFLNEMKRASEGIFAEMKKPQNTVNRHVSALKKEILEPKVQPKPEPKHSHLQPQQPIPSTTTQEHPKNDEKPQ